MYAYVCGFCKTRNQCSSYLINTYVCFFFSTFKYANRELLRMSAEFKSYAIIITLLRKFWPYPYVWRHSNSCVTWKRTFNTIITTHNNMCYCTFIISQTRNLKKKTIFAALQLYNICICILCCTVLAIFFIETRLDTTFFFAA